MNDNKNGELNNKITISQLMVYVGVDSSPSGYVSTLLGVRRSRGRGGVVGQLLSRTPFPSYTMILN